MGLHLRKSVLPEGGVLSEVERLSVTRGRNGHHTQIGQCDWLKSEQSGALLSSPERL